jgi:2-hydroxyglutarate dehydrogenase
VVLEKEDRVAVHQTGHNSGVIHSGLYYTPGSAKARLCVEGRRLVLDYCATNGITTIACGKLVVASDESELGSLETLRQRGVANGLRSIEVLDQSGIRDAEPAVLGLRALWVGEAGIVDYGAVARALSADLRAGGVELRLGAAVGAITVTANDVAIRTRSGDVVAGQAIGCAGLGSDRLAVMAGADPLPKIVPFRGDYYLLRPERRALVRGLVYPVPDARFPFLGVHFTPRVDGSVLLGPNAVLALAREGYRRRDVSLGDLRESIGYAGFRRLAARHWRTGLAEMVGDVWKPSFLARLRRYMPALSARDLLPGPSGVRAQALDRDGRLVDDFVFDETGRFLNVRNAPSPAATSSLALAAVFVDRITGDRTMRAASDASR